MSNEISKKIPFSVTVLGSGTSQGVPVIACGCDVCTSENPKDKRLRTSILFTIDGKNYLVDAGPDFRQQMLRENVQSLEAILLTHQHKDHIAGLDDVRAFNFKEHRDMKIYCDSRVDEALHREFEYIFSSFKYPGIPRLDIEIIDKNALIPLHNGDQILAIEVMHYKLPVMGFRYQNFAYITDANFISEEEQQKLKGLDTLIINALRHEEHISHFNLAQALEMIEILQPNRAYLTHISHFLGKYDDVMKGLPNNVELAYDGLKIMC